MNWFRALVSADDRTVCIVTVGGGLGLLAFLGLSIYAVSQDAHQWNPTNYGMGLGAVLGALGVGKGAQAMMTPPLPPAPVHHEN